MGMQKTEMTLSNADNGEFAKSRAKRAMRACALLLNIRAPFGKFRAPSRAIAHFVVARK